MKRTLAFLLTALMVLGTCVFAVSAATKVDTDLKWKLTSEEVDADFTGTVTLELWTVGLTDADDLGSLNVKIKFDTEKLQLLGQYPSRVTGSGRTAVTVDHNLGEFAKAANGGSVGQLSNVEIANETGECSFVYVNVAEDNMKWDSEWYFNNYDCMAEIDFNVKDGWNGETTLEVIDMGTLRRSDGAALNAGTINGTIKRGKAAPAVNTLTVAAEGNGTAYATVNGQLTSGITTETGFIPEVGSTVTLGASGDNFKFWKNAKTDAIVSTEKEFSYTATESIRGFVAVFEDEESDTFSVIYKDIRTGRIYKVDEVDAGTALTDADAPIPAPMLGYSFRAWEIPVEGQPSLPLNGYVVTEDTLVLGLYNRDGVATNTLTVKMGDYEKSFERPATAICTIASNEDNFSYWTWNGNVISTSKTFQFTMPDQDATIVAVYDAIDAPEATLVMVENSLEDGYLFTTFTRSLADGCTPVESGILYTRKATAEDLVVPVAAQTVTKGISTASNSADSFGFVKDLNGKEGTWLVRGYMIYKDGEGALKTVYTTVNSITF